MTLAKSYHKALEVLKTLILKIVKSVKKVIDYFKAVFDWGDILNTLSTNRH